MRNYISLHFIPHFAIRIACAFIFFTAAGTLLHELGHIAVAKYFGYETSLHYGYMNYDYPGVKQDPIYLEMQVILQENREDLQNKVDFPAKTRYLELLSLMKEKYKYPKPHSQWVTLGGPAQTILTSIIGLFILYRRKSKEKEFFVMLDWLGVFLSLFALREIFNFISASISSIFFGRSNFNGDEFRLSRMFGLNEWIIPSIGLLIGLVIALYVIFKVIPIKYRFSFILAGLVGGILGFFIWLEWLGPTLIP